MLTRLQVLNTELSTVTVPVMNKFKWSRTLANSAGSSSKPLKTNKPDFLWQFEVSSGHALFKNLNLKSLSRWDHLVLSSRDVSVRWSQHETRRNSQYIETRQRRWDVQKTETSQPAETRRLVLAISSRLTFVSSRGKPYWKFEAQILPKAFWRCLRCSAQPWWYR